MGIALLCTFHVLPKEGKLQTGLQDFLICIEVSASFIQPEELPTAKALATCTHELCLLLTIDSILSSRVLSYIPNTCYKDNQSLCISFSVPGLTGMLYMVGCSELARI